jgi:hypothetical protein
MAHMWVVLPRAVALLAGVLSETGETAEALGRLQTRSSGRMRERAACWASGQV